MDHPTQFSKTWKYHMTIYVLHGICINSCQDFIISKYLYFVEKNNIVIPWISVIYNISNDNFIHSHIPINLNPHSTSLLFMFPCFQLGHIYP